MRTSLRVVDLCKRSQSGLRRYKSIQNCFNLLPVYAFEIPSLLLILFSTSNVTNSPSVKFNHHFFHGFNYCTLLCSEHKKSACMWQGPGRLCSQFVQQSFLSPFWVTIYLSHCYQYSIIPYVLWVHHGELWWLMTSKL